MKAVNLIPAESRKGGGAVTSVQAASYGLVGVLAVALALITLYVMASNKVAARQAQLSALSSEVQQTRSEATGLQGYTAFDQLARTRVQTVEGIAATRFDWHAALADLSRVVPASTSLASLTATVAPGASAGGSAAGVGSGLRGDISAPAFELAGCSASQDDVARLMSRLRLIAGVTRVTLGDSQKSAAAAASAPASGSGGSAGSSQGCGANRPSFDLVVFFQPVAGAGPNGATGLGTVTSSGGSR